jgi:hypothetical protein
VNAIPEGQYVKHYRYGMGVVTESDDRQTSIDFDVHGLEAIRNHAADRRAF